MYIKESTQIYFTYQYLVISHQLEYVLLKLTYYESNWT